MSFDQRLSFLQNRPAGSTTQPKVTFVKSSEQPPSSFYESPPFNQAHHSGAPSDTMLSKEASSSKHADDESSSYVATSDKASSIGTPGTPSKKAYKYAPEKSSPLKALLLAVASRCGHT